MTKLAANLTMLFTELPFIERFRAAAQANFKAVEFLFPYAFEPAQIVEQLRKNELELVLHNLPAGNWKPASAASPVILIASVNSARASTKRSATQKYSASSN